MTGFRQKVHKFMFFTTNIEGKLPVQHCNKDSNSTINAQERYIRHNSLTPITLTIIGLLPRTQSID